MQMIQSGHHFVEIKRVGRSKMLVHERYGEIDGVFGHMVMPGGGECMSLSSGKTILGYPVVILGWTTDRNPAQIIDALGGFVAKSSVLDVGAAAYLRSSENDLCDFVEGPTRDVLRYIGSNIGHVTSLHVPIEPADSGAALIWNQRRVNVYGSRRRHAAVRFEADGATALTALGGVIFETATVHLRDSQDEVMEAIVADLQRMA